MACHSLQCLYHFTEHRFEAIGGNLIVMLVEDAYKAGHMGPFEMLGKADIHIEVGNGVLLLAGAILDDYRVTDILDAHFVDGDLTGISAALYINHAVIAHGNSLFIGYSQ
jgi:hypothetical protein